MVKRYNDICRLQIPKITPYNCRYTYCSNMAKAGMNPKVFQYLMGRSDIGVTLNTYMYFGLDDATDKIRRGKKLEEARKEMGKVQGEKTIMPKGLNQYNVESMKRSGGAGAFFLWRKIWGDGIIKIKYEKYRIADDADRNKLL